MKTEPTKLFKRPVREGGSLSLLSNGLPRALFLFVGCRGTQIRFWSSAISLLKSRILPRFTAICRAEKVVNNL